MDGVIQTYRGCRTRHIIPAERPDDVESEEDADGESQDTPDTCGDRGEDDVCGGHAQPEGRHYCRSAGIVRRWTSRNNETSQDYLFETV